MSSVFIPHYSTIDLFILSKINITISEWVVCEIIHRNSFIEDRCEINKLMEEISLTLNCSFHIINTSVKKLIKCGYVTSLNNRNFGTTQQWHSLFESGVK